MNCVTHPAVEAVAYCRICGRAMCAECKRDIRGTIYCEPCLEREMHATAPPPTIPYNSGAPTGPLPGLAFGLGFIPGVGAIYNGQYAKAFVHVIIFGLLISVLDSGEAGHFEVVFALLLPAFIFYMAFEAFHTARKRLLGQPVDEWSGVFSSDTAQAQSGGANGGSMVGPRSGGAIFLIALGALLLLGNLGYISLHQVLRFWPLILIGLGVAMLVRRMNIGSEGGR